MSPRYTVVFSQRLDEQLDEWERIAIAEGRGDEFTDALEKIMEGLRLVPHDLGESRTLYSQMRIQGRNYFIGSLTVDFGVHLDQPLVFIRRFHWRQRR